MCLQNNNRIKATPNTVSWGNLTCHNICKVTMTGYQTLKYSNHLITIYLYRDSTIAHAHHDSKYCAIPACYRDCSLPNYRDGKPDSCAGNANYHNCRAVSVNNGRRVIMINCTLYTYSLAPRWFAFITG